MFYSPSLYIGVLNQGRMTTPFGFSPLVARFSTLSINLEQLAHLVESPSSQLLSIAVLPMPCYTQPQPRRSPSGLAPYRC